MASHAVPTSDRRYQDDTGDYQLPNDAPEHDRLDDQSAALIDLLNNKPFHAPITQPKRMIDIGCGTGVMTNLLASIYPEAEVFGVDITAVPESRHGRRPNVRYIQGDIRALVRKHPQLQLGTFDFVFQRLLVFGMTEWGSFIELAANLLCPGGWLESQEATMELWSADDPCVSKDWYFYQQCLADSKSLGIDVEVGRKLQGIYSKTASLEDVSESIYSFAPKARTEAPELAGLEGRIESLFSLVCAKICAQKRSEAEVRKIVEDVSIVWQQGFQDSDKFHMHVVTGRRSVYY